MKKITIVLLSIFYTFNIFAQKDSIDLNEVSISVSRIQTNVSQCPSQVAIIKSNTIEFSNPQTTAHLLENSGQVMVQRSQGGGGSPIMRGFEANKVLLVVDGVRMNNAIYRGGHLQNVITLDPNMLERVELLFGGNSLLYGSDALGGVMYFQTKKPETFNDDDLHIKIGGMTRYSTANQEKTVNFKLNIAKKRFGFLSNFTYSDFGDLRSGGNFSSKYGNWGKRTFYVERINNVDSVLRNDKVSLQRGTAYSQYDFFQKVLFKQNEYITHSLNFQLSNSSDIPRYDRLTEIAANGKPTTAEWYYGPQKRTMLSYQLENKRKTFFSDYIQIVAAFQDIEESRNTRNFNNLKRTQRIENVKVMSVNADFRKTVRKRENQYGIEVQANDVNSKASFVNVKTGETGAASTRYPDGGSQMNSFAAYFADRYKKSENTSFSFGIRYNYTTLNAVFNDKTFYPFPFNNLNQKHSALVSNLGFTQNFKNDFSISGSLSSTYRAPNVDDVAKVFESAAGRLIIPNNNLKPEKTYGSELVITKKWNNRQSSVQIVPFATLYNDALTLAPSQFEGKDSIIYAGKKSAIFSTQNISNAYIYGFTANTRILINTNLSLSASYTFTKGRVLDNEKETPLDHIPPTFGRIALDYQKEKLQVSLYSLFNGAKKASDYRLKTEDNELYSADPIKGFMPAWATLNLRGSYDFQRNIALQIGLENILDQHYRIFASGISAAGRNVNVTLRFKI
jgi:hemoglobin/transferrin/lactoferrin receptor protein